MSRLIILLLSVHAHAQHNARTGPDLSIPWAGAAEDSAVTALHREYGNIFKHGNRNAASHLWSTFLLERSEQMTHEKLVQMFTGFCAVSGSPIRPSDYNRYKLMLPIVGSPEGKRQQGFLHYCCWPCVCDTQDFIRTDSKTIKTLSGERVYRMAVIGNPCEHPEKFLEPFVQPFDGRSTTIARDAAEVRCGDDGHLIGATLSDHGLPIINMFFDLPGMSPGNDEEAATAVPVASTMQEGPPQPGRLSTTTVGGVLFNDEFEFRDMCSSRAAAGYNSGMGEIFRRVAAISVIP